MTRIASMVFNPFSENTYILYDDTKECIIIDPGCYDEQEQKQMDDFIEDNKLNPVRLINTHCHVDHVFGNKYIFEKYGLAPEFHKLEQAVYNAYPQVAMMYGLESNQPVKAKSYLKETDILRFGNSEAKILFTPGHSPGSLSFFFEKANFLIGGDVLFKHSIGRTDLPGGDYDTLLNAICDKILPLPESTIVYSGHGEPTTVGEEKKSNPFIKDFKK